MRLLWWVIACSCVLLGFSLGQEQDPRTVWPYGGRADPSRYVWVWDTSRATGHGYPLSFRSTANFNNAKFNSAADFYRAGFLRTAEFRRAEFDSTADFFGTQFDSTADFFGAQFNNSADFSHSRLNSVANFRYTQFYGSTEFRYAQFYSTAEFRDTYFYSVAEFKKAQFDRSANFFDTQFYSAANFDSAEFHGIANFDSTQFHGTVDFAHAQFDSTVNFKYAQFTKEVSFRNCIFPEFESAGIIWGTEIDLTDTKFESPIDFRLLDFDNVKTIYVSENTDFQDGEFLVNWHQLQGTDNALRLCLGNPTVPDTTEENYGVLLEVANKENFSRLEIFYSKLINNFKTQNKADQSTLDAIEYEIEWQRNEYIGGFWHSIYGWVLGWGYQPWRFLLLVVVPLIIAFAFLWHMKYMYVLEQVIFKEQVVGSVKIRGKFDGSRKLRNAWFSLWFSTSVLLGIRFKKIWFVNRENFLTWVSIEWGLGIALFVLFAYFVRGGQFAYVKGLLGF